MPHQIFALLLLSKIKNFRFMKNLHCIVISFLLCIVPIYVHAVGERASDYYFVRLTDKEGISQCDVKCIVQDNYGFLWFGTKNGLNRFDGKNIRIFKCEDTERKVGNNNISALFEDKHSRLWVGTDCGVYIYDPRTEKFSFFDKEAKKIQLKIEGWISEIKADQSGNIWIVSPSEGVFRYDGKELHHYYITTWKLYVSENPECMCVCRNGDVWIGTNHAGLFRYNPAQDNFEQFIDDSYGNTFRNDNIYAICEYNGNIIVGVHEGELKKYNLDMNTITIMDTPEVHYSVIRDVKCYDNRLWVGTQNGIFVIDENKGTNIHITEDLTHPYGLNDKMVRTIYSDRSGGIWVGTMFGGVNYRANEMIHFEKYVSTPSDNSLSSRKVRELAEDYMGRIWIGTEDGGINVLEPSTGEVHPVNYDFFEKNNSLTTLAMCMNGDKLLCGLFKKGMCEVDVNTGKINYISPEELGLKNESSVNTLYKDRQGNWWLANLWSLYLKPKGGKNFEIFEKLGYYWISDILEDNEGNMWFAFLGNGVCKYNPREGTFQYYSHQSKDDTSLSSNTVSSIMQDSKGRIWLSTDRGGLCLYNKEKDNFKTYSINEGLPDDVVYKVLEDKDNNLWFGTNRGLVMFNPETGKVNVFTYRDGLLCNQFNYKSALKGRDGRFYFGGVDGLIAFNPNKLKATRKDKQLPLYITRFSVNNEEQYVNDEGGMLEQSILFTRKLVLGYDKSNISFDFAALDFSSGHAVKYMYRMEPLGTEWLPVSESGNLSFLQLPAGHYRLNIRASNELESVQAETYLDIVITPPWWRSVIAYICYFLLFIGALISSIVVYVRRTSNRMKEKQRLFELEKEKELYSAKIEFFTEIAHEIRTPLTLIKGPMDCILEMNIKNPSLQRYLNAMSQNTKRLLDLTHQLLDFRKVGTKKLIPNFMMVDVVSLLRETVERFEPTIQQRKKEIALQISTDECMAAIDREAVVKILSNLFNNGLKYALHAIKVELRVDESYFSVLVSSDGEKITDEMAEKIFDPFFRLQQNDSNTSGVGMGLPMARSLAELHHGTLYLDTSVPEMNVFILRLPLAQEDVIQLEELSPVMASDVLPQSKLFDDTEHNEYTVLLVEDNLPVQQFVCERLRKFFAVETADNGVEALAILRERQVDIVVTDIMMPVMDGMRLCEEIKRDLDLTHIPIIFLTAKNDIDSKINGLKTGAEAFVEKPFSFDYLKEQILSILTNRQRARDLFIKRPFTPVENMKMNKADEEFMEKLIRVVQENFTNENFNVEHMANILCMSRSSLLRKIKALTNLSAIDFIRLIRLKKAAELIQDGRYRIAEICFMVGINTPSYFSKLFQKQFGMTPKEFEKQCQAASRSKNMDVEEG